MTLVTELDLPALDPSDPTLKGDAFHDALRDAASDGWLASAPLGFVVLDREAASFFLRTKQATFPGLKIAEIFGIEEGPLAEEIRRNILHLNGADHSRLRNLVNPAFTPRAADRWRPAMRELLEQLWARWRRERALRGRRGPAPSPIPRSMIATRRGRRPRATPRACTTGPTGSSASSTAPSLMADRDQIEQAVAEFYEWAGRADRRPPRAPARRPRLRARRGRGGRRPALRRRAASTSCSTSSSAASTRPRASSRRRCGCSPPTPTSGRCSPRTRSSCGRAVDEIVRFEPITPFTARIMSRRRSSSAT